MGKNKRVLALSLVILSFVSLGKSQGVRGSRLDESQDRLGVERVLALLDSDRVRSYLGLEGPQVERLRQIALEAEKANVKLRADVEVRSIDLREAFRAIKPDRDEILKKVQEISNLRGEMMKQNVEAILAAKAVLSPEQQKKVMFFIESREAGGPAGEERRDISPRPEPRQPRPGVTPPAAPRHPGEPPVE
jgi:hypothetical protein